jgi:hypothetical protein
VEEVALPGAGTAGSNPAYILGRPGRKKATFRFRTLDEAERALNRVVNLMVERGKSEQERVLAQQDYERRKVEVRSDREAYMRVGRPPEAWPSEPPVFVAPPLRGLSTEARRDGGDGQREARGHEDEK